MRQVGMFEAKAKLSEICDEVVRSREGVVITRRGKPLVRIDPLAVQATSVWEDRANYIARTGRMKKEFELPPRSTELPASPLDDSD